MIASKAGWTRKKPRAHYIGVKIPMKVFRVEFEVNDYQSLLASDDSVHENQLLAFDGAPKENFWGQSLAAELDNLNGNTPDIFDLGAGNMLLHGRSLELIGPYLNSNYERLPVHWGVNNSGYCINPLQLHNCIDSSNCEWCIDDESGKKLFIERFVFHKTKIPNALVFKDNLECFELFTTDAEGSFRSIVNKHKLTGISFELLWEG